MSLICPHHYVNKLSISDTQKAIKLVKDTFEEALAERLNLTRVSAPMFVEANSGLNDNLNGEKPVSFYLPNLNKEVEIVQSLAKWKRYALGKYAFSEGMGLYTDMNAIRAHEVTDNLHSIYVDQWDWEKVINKNNRNIDYLKTVVQKIIDALVHTNNSLKSAFPNLSFEIEPDVYFITSQALLDMYPNLSPKEREHEICRLKKTVFIIGIGNELSDGKPHDSRAPDYDDWDLNGDILLYYPLLDCAVEISSMGIRVNREVIIKQLQQVNALERINLPFHQAIINNQLPLTIGGGIGQSRICLLLLEKLHIGEVQVSTWEDADILAANKHSAHIL